MKCATTTLHAQFAAQSGIYVPDKIHEPDYFNDDDRYARGNAWYASLFSGAETGDLIGDISTGYTKCPTDPRTVERMRQDLEQPRFVYIMRHPVDRLISHYIHDWSVGRIKDSIDEAVESHRPLIDYGRYAMQLRPYFDAFGSSQILPVFFERLIDASQLELERICAFIGYPGQPRWVNDQDRVNVSSTRMRRSPLRDAIVNAPVLRTIRRRLIPKGLREGVKRMWAIGERPQLSEATEQRVVEEFDSDLGELGDWLGIDLDCAKFKERVTSLEPAWTSNTPGPVQAHG